MKILAIDPGYERVGLAVLEKDQKKDFVIYSECFKTSSKTRHCDRLAKIQKKIEEVIKNFKPEDLAIETLFFNKNVKTALMVAEARGVMLATSRNLGLNIFEYSPQQIKTAVTGSGKSDKNGIIKMIPLLIKIDKNIKHDDEFDAIATGICHLASKKALI